MKFGADVNIRSQDQRTPLMWAAWRDNVGMIDLLLEYKPDLEAVDKDGWNALDLAITRINYKAAKRLTELGLTRKDKEAYEGKCFRKYDI